MYVLLSDIRIANPIPNMHTGTKYANQKPTFNSSTVVNALDNDPTLLLIKSRN
jgi:hypothetical protein